MRSLIIAGALTVLSVAACTGEDIVVPTDGPLPLDQVETWAYQIQDLFFPDASWELAVSRYDMIVVEPTRTDWSSEDAREFDTEAMVAELAGSAAGDGVHRKRVVAYVDIGEAEDWRWYWTWSTTWEVGDPMPADWPDYIVGRDPDGWDGNYPVAYWDPAWKNVVLEGDGLSAAPHGDWVSIVDETIRAGFDGIYLDWVEAFEDETVRARAAADGVDPAEEMITFIGEMRAYARERDPEFLIIQQNAASLIDGHPELADVIDAIAQEAIWYDGSATDSWRESRGHDLDNDADLVEYYLDHLATYRAAGLPVFDCEYALQNADDAYEKSSAEGFVPYATRRSLGRISTTPPPGL